MSHPKRRRRPEEEPEEHENHERWLVSYADMITVLMALFIVLFAMSSVDQTKFEALKESLASSFGKPIAAVQTGKTPSVGESDAQDGVLDVGSFTLASSPQISKEIDHAVSAARAKDALTAAEKSRADVEREVRSMEAVRKAILAALAKHHLEHSVRFRFDERGLVISVITDKVLFAADRATLSPIGNTVLDAIAPALRVLPHDLMVEGHTNQVPVAPKYYPSEWELSGARATTVVRHLISADGISPKRLSATAYADQRPLIEGTSPRANRLNRRVEIVVASKLPADERAQLSEIASNIETQG
jgi:chemotaxis protein MotB